MSNPTSLTNRGYITEPLETFEEAKSSNPRRHSSEPWPPPENLYEPAAKCQLWHAHTIKGTSWWPYAEPYVQYLFWTTVIWRTHIGRTLQELADLCIVFISICTWYNINMCVCFELHYIPQKDEESLLCVFSHQQKVAHQASKSVFMGHTMRQRAVTSHDSIWNLAQSMENAATSSFLSRSQTCLPLSLLLSSIPHLCSLSSQHIKTFQADTVVEQGLQFTTTARCYMRR